MKAVWVVEHRQWSPCNSRNCMEKYLDTVVMTVGTTLEMAISLMKGGGPPAKEGWFVIYPEAVDSNDLIMGPEYQEEGRMILKIFDLQGNPLTEQPDKYSDDVTH